MFQHRQLHRVNFQEMLILFPSPLRVDKGPDTLLLSEDVCVCVWHWGHWVDESKTGKRYYCFSYLIYYTHVCLVAQLCPTFLWPHGLQPTRLLYPWNFPGKNTGVGCHFLLQGIFPTQRSNLCLLGLLYWQVDSLPLGRLGSYWSIIGVAMSVSIHNIKNYVFIVKILTSH